MKTSVNILQQDPATNDYPLGITGFYYSDLYKPERLKDLAFQFYSYLDSSEPELGKEFASYRKTQGKDMAKPVESLLLIRVARYQSKFIAKLFGIEEEQAKSIEEHCKHNPIIKFKKEFIIRRVLKRYQTLKTSCDKHALERDGCLESAELLNIVAAVMPDLKISEDPELVVAIVVSELMNLELRCQKAVVSSNPNIISKEENDLIALLREKLTVNIKNDNGFLQDIPYEPLAVVQYALERLENWVTVAYHAKEHHKKYADWVSFRIPEEMGWPDRLVKFERPNPDLPNSIETPSGTLRYRRGFKLTDPRWSLREVMDHSNYCLICHEREKDSCSKGLPLPRKDKPLQRNPLGVLQTGCPLDERVSEMHLLKREGDTIAALAMIAIDNPMCAVTGHRICNDCMKGCIFQKQEPVNIPQLETRILIDTLELPWGVEIYSLLTRWNPVNVRCPYMLPYNGKNVLVVGMGPAGFSLAEYLMNEGFGVVGIDGLKIEPLPKEIAGHLDMKPEFDILPRPIKSFSELLEECDERVSYGFGGVAEYGITNRWDKNFLKLIYLTLRRNRSFRVYGGVRFGGTLLAEDAWNLGFHHVAIAAGAGRPTILDMKNNLIPGIRKASDFLMGLQLTGAYKKFSVVNLQLRMPVVVIGGGLTGIDTATEALAYYPLQVEKIAERFYILAKEFGEEAIWKLYNEEETNILREFLEHGRAVIRERANANSLGRTPDFISLCKSWGGVSLVYRKGIQDAPAYRANHEEIIKALEEGITYIECLDPKESIPDKYGWVSAVQFEKIKKTVVANADGKEEIKWENTGEFVTLPAKSVLVAAGTTPNIIYEKERPGLFKMDSRKKFFQGHKVINGKLVEAPQTREDHGFFTSYEKNGKFISYYGDNHPVYAGNVVKAVASAKFGSLAVTGLFSSELEKLDPASQSEREAAWRELCVSLDDQMKAVVTEIKRLTSNITEVIVKAPLQARQFQPGQFYRLQNYETRSSIVKGSKLQMEGVALTGAWVDKEKGLLSMIALELGVSSRLCAFLKKGEEVIAMGPTGSPSEIGKNENVVLCGGGLGNAVMFSIAKGMKEAGCKVLYFAGYKKPDDLFHIDDIEAACDQVIWSVDAGEPIKPRRPQDRTFVGNIVQSMLAYAKGEQGEQLFSMKCTNRILVIGSDRMMAAVKDSRYGVLKEYFDHPHDAIASINSPMQCMMKEVCAQCLQRHKDPVTGKESYVFSCFNQDQKMDEVDWGHLNQRLRQNTVQEKLANFWLTYLLQKEPIPHV